jgi:hypothetical protein
MDYEEIKPHIKKGVEVSLLPEIKLSFTCPEGRYPNLTAVVLVELPYGGLVMDRDLMGCRYWNKTDVEEFKE